MIAHVTRPDGSLALPLRVGLLAFVVVFGVAALADPITFVLFASYAVVGVLLVIRRPRNPVSWLLLVIPIAFVGTSTVPDLDAAALSRGDGSLRDVLSVWVASWSGHGIWLAYTALALVFPSGHLPAGASRRFALALLGVSAAVIVLVMIAPMIGFSPDGESTVVIRNPFGLLPAEVGDLSSSSVPVVLGLLAVSVAHLYFRYREADGVARVQMRWLLVAIALVVAGVVAGLILLVTLGEQLGDLVWIPAIVAYPTISLAVAVAVLRYRLYDIDRVVNRAIMYGSLTAILAGALAAASAVSQRLFMELTGDRSDIAVILTTLVVATLYSPVRVRVEDVVDRYFKYEQRQFGKYRAELEQLATLLDPTRAAARLAKEAAVETGARGAAVVDGSGVVVASYGQWPLDIVARVPIAGNSTLREVLVGPKRDGRRVEQRSIDALAAVTDAFGAVVQAR